MAPAMAVRVAPDRVSSGTFLHKMPLKNRCGATVSLTSCPRRNEMHRGGVHAIAQSGWLWAIVEYVPEMRVAERARHFRAGHHQTIVSALDDIFFRDRRPETRPARAGIVFRVGAVERVGAADAAIDAFVVAIVALAGKCDLGIRAARDVVLIRGELRAPFGVGLHHLRD